MRELHRRADLAGTGAGARRDRACARGNRRRSARLRRIPSPDTAGRPAWRRRRAGARCAGAAGWRGSAVRARSARTHRAVGLPADQLDRGLLLEVAVGALGEIHRAHAAAAEAAAAGATRRAGRLRRVRFASRSERVHAAGATAPLSSSASERVGAIAGCRTPAPASSDAGAARRGHAGADAIQPPPPRRMRIGRVHADRAGQRGHAPARAARPLRPMRAPGCHAEESSHGNARVHPRRSIRPWAGRFILTQMRRAGTGGALRSPPVSALFRPGASRCAVFVRALPESAATAAAAAAPRVSPRRSTPKSFAASARRHRHRVVAHVVVEQSRCASFIASA